MATIFDPIQIKQVHFANRVVMAAAVKMGLPCQDGVFGRELMADYQQIASTNIGLLTTQALAVQPDQKGVMAGAYQDEHIAYLKALADAVHQYQTKLFGQLNLMDYDIANADCPDINQLSTAQIERIRDDYICAAYRLKCAGFDGVELHGAHGRFLNMMFCSRVNKRADRYGGSMAKRARILAEIVEGIRAFADDHFIISLRFGYTEDLAGDIELARLFVSQGIELLHLSNGIPEKRELDIPRDFPYNDIVYTAARIKEAVDVPVTAVNQIETLARGNALIERGACDFAAYCRPFLADKAFFTRASRQMDYRPCFLCKRCQWFTDGRKCPRVILLQRQDQRRDALASGDPAAKAAAYFDHGYNCAQAVVCAFSEHFGLDEKSAYRVAEAFCGGMGGDRGPRPCGAVSGMMMVASLAKSTGIVGDLQGKRAACELACQLRDAFEQKHASILCSELVQNGGRAYCRQCVRDAAELLKQALWQRP